ncbi:biotin carboxylase N-terminal domain-containing protein [Actinoplanes sp. NPDC051343]|uniref:ATP-binding protein n=1 Tax=Actinoplanes sp. NPDC051343 TaxID=3363906 RepID=UPI003794F20C
MIAFTSVLVANRGEIARRVFATCRRRGLATVAVFSDPDAGAPHVLDADSAVRLPGSSAADTYLRGDLIIGAALRAGADAIHPGYGFLSENADFAQAVIDAGLAWIGPPPSAIQSMGSKIESKCLMAAAGVPVLERLDPTMVTEDDLPLLVKASAGGGGRGMRVVHDLAALPEAVASAEREAAAAFGDPAVFCERYLEDGHHVEVQVMADAHGTVWALGERECSLQRRHQKVIEEAPSPLVDHLGGDLRSRLLAAGRDAAAAVGYQGAGTVEFLADDKGGFWFLEMNTRLQVEHPVTEAVTGTDLVGLQLDVASGAPLTGPEPTMTGHAIEARLYAESPLDDWRPRTGKVITFDIPAATSRFAGPPLPGVRVDAGIADGTEVGVHYDAMLAKVIAYGKSREAVARQLAGALRRSRVHGVPTNRDLLVVSLLHPDFLAGTAGTGFYAAHPPAALLAAPGLDPDVAAIVAALADVAHERSSLLPGLRSGFRSIPAGYQSRAYAAGERSIEVRYRFERDGVAIEGHDGISAVSFDATSVLLSSDGVQRSFSVTRFDDRVVVDGPLGSVELTVIPRFVDPAAALPAGALIAPMPGTVVRIAASVGTTVTTGQPLLWLEAMKMEHVVRAPASGVLTSLPVEVGRQVAQGTPLAVVDGNEA